MGRVRPHFIKRLARDMVDKHGDKFGEDFEENKEILKEMDSYESRKLRNRVAGYIVRVVQNKKFDE